jgi:hypothetical protein
MVDSIPPVNRIACPPNHPLTILIERMKFVFGINIVLGDVRTSSVLRYTEDLLTLHSGGSRNLLGLVVLLGFLGGLVDQALLEGAMIFTRQLLKGVTLGLGDQPGGQNAAEH